MKEKLTPGVDYIGVTTPFYCLDGMGKILLHKRGKKCRDEKGNWDAGGGKLEFGEKLRNGVLREIREEYGCNGKILEQMDAVSVVREENGQPTHWLAVPFIVLVDPKEVRNCEPEKVEDLQWFDIEHLPHPLHSAFETYIVKTERMNTIRKYAFCLKKS